ncbi:MAG: asparagine synthetase B, partial [Verrucomicrobia bacterium]|nr:asparagine synthetase B [Verrucomicrobiota bacterium]
LGDDILRKVDIAGMACSLECRCPFLDHEAAGFAAMLPADSKADWRGRTKLLLRKLYPDILPPALFARRKKGFSMPIGSWMRKQWKEVVRNSIEDSWSDGMAACFDRRILTRLWQEHQEGRQDHGERLWSWLVLFRWNQRFRPQWRT